MFSYLAKQDARLISGIELKPEIKVDAHINKNKFKKFFVLLRNQGPVDAHQLEAKFITHQYYEKTKKIQVSGRGSDTTFTIPKLSPFKDVTFEVSEHFLYGNAMLQEPKEYNILELRISYRRFPDYPKFSESAFYYVNPDGLWVGEYSSSLSSDLYERLKQAAYAMLSKDITLDLGWDRLHPVMVEE